eukprot:scaffold45710_cov204-Skeletonema_marinoi.AAC.1
MDFRWPTTPSSLREVAKESMIPEAHKLCLRIMSMLERRGCKHLEPWTLEKAHSLWETDSSRCCLRLLHYPPMPINDRNTKQVPGNVHWRAAPHTDFTCLSLLFQREGEGGLECRANPRSTAGASSDA